MPTLRRLTTRDIPSAVNLSTLAGWNQTAADWDTLLRLQPDGCLAIECDGDVVATTTLICYGDQLAWLGMVLTHPDYRKQGLARRLVSSAIHLAGEMKIRSVKLDATDLGLPLYESLGFRKERLIERWCVLGVFSRGLNLCVPTGVPDYELDREAFGVDRRRLLEILMESAASFVVSDGFAVVRPGARASYLGPCVARSAESARLLIEGCISTLGAGCFWDLFPSNIAAVRIAEDLGFSRTRTLTRMVMGQETRGCEEMIYAVGGFELG